MLSSSIYLFSVLEVFLKFFLSVLISDGFFKLLISFLVDLHNLLELVVANIQMLLDLLVGLWVQLVLIHAIFESNSFQVLNKQTHFVAIFMLNELKVKLFDIFEAKEVTWFTMVNIVNTPSSLLILEEHIHLWDVLGTIIDGFHIF